MTSVDGRDERCWSAVPSPAAPEPAVPTPPTLRSPSLTPDQAAGLADLVVAVEARQRADLRAAVDQGIRHVPRLLRGPVKALLLR